jgi:hypothetical protein
MTTILDETRDPHAERYWENLEDAIMAQTLADNSGVSLERQKALRRLWALGTFNAVAYGLKSIAGCGMLEWNTAEGGQIDLIYKSPYGTAYPLGRVYRQPNGTWGALVIAGVTDDQYEAMARCEWAIARLTAEEVPERKAA